MTKIALIGYGKMGRMIAEVAQQPNNNDLEIIHKIDKNDLEKLTDNELQQADVAIEFSTPESAFDNIKRCISVGIPVVSGTTGWLDRQQEINKFCIDTSGAFLYASNFSIGMNIFFEVNKHLAGIMSAQAGYTVGIDETHHIHKKDSPSGTAIHLAEDIIAEHRGKSRWVNNPTGEPDDLLILSHRKGEVPGRHEVKYTGEADSITINHTANSRKGFAEGALLAARWIIGKKGIFSMRNVLGL